MKRSDIRKIVREVLDEANVTGTGASFTPGQGAQYATPFAFGKNKKAQKATKGYKEVKKRKRPYHTKGFDYLD